MMNAVDGVYRLFAPSVVSCALVVDSPHSGRVYPADYRYACRFKNLRRAEDAYVDELCQAVTSVGGSLLVADFPRAYIDPNREIDDLNPDLVDGIFPTELRPGVKTKMGIGLIREKLSNGESIYSDRLSVSTVEKRIADYYLPYHAALDQLLRAKLAQFGSVWHIDMHSMASHANAVTPDAPGRRDFDMVLGDLDGSSCDAALTSLVHKSLKECGYRVRINDPYKGAAITRRYGRPSEGVHTLQIEINRALYLDESKTEKHAGFSKLEQSLANLFSVLAAHAPAA